MATSSNKLTDIASVLDGMTPNAFNARQAAIKRLINIVSSDPSGSVAKRFKDATATLEARRDAAAGQALAALLTKALHSYMRLTGADIQDSPVSLLYKSVWLTDRLLPDTSLWAGVSVHLGKPQRNVDAIVSFSSKKLPPGVKNDRYTNANVIAQVRLNLKYVDGMYVPGNPWVARGNPHLASVLAAARAAWKPVKDQTYVHAGLAVSRRRANDFVETIVRKRRSQPQNGEPWLDSLALDRNKLKQLAQAHPHLASRSLRDPFDVTTHHGSKLFARQPRKADLKNMIAHWTTENYKNVQAVRRANGAIPLTSRGSRAVMLQKLDSALATYMRQFTLRAPQLPPKVRNVTTGSATPVLYRGARLTPPQYNALLMGTYSDKGYMAFSRNPSYAVTFVSRSHTPNTVLVLFRLSTARVQRGTPWIWYASSTESLGLPAEDFIGGVDYPGPALPPELQWHPPNGWNDNARRARPHGRRLRRQPNDPHKFNRSFVRPDPNTDEHEVLLPPGHLTPLTGHLTPLTVGGVTVYQVDVAFEPSRSAGALWNGKPVT